MSSGIEALFANCPRNMQKRPAIGLLSLLALRRSFYKAENKEGHRLRYQCSRPASPLPVRNSSSDTTAVLINEYVRLIQQDSIPCEPGDPPVTKLKDKDDLGILSAAISGKLDVLVTGDKELQRVGMAAAVKIMSPREFWQELVQSG
jgi:hypothetical protein